MTPEQSETIFLDVRERLARIEVKIDNTNETLRAHDRRITENHDNIEALKDEVVAHKAKMKAYAKIATAIGAAGGLLAWLMDHSHTLAAITSAIASG